ncbi:MAG: DNA polymerase III subunit gamma/tau [Tissierellia bacterium]|nr:DNA polymerase III subunit gamma/tau [Tissierellia bacterium]
MRKAIYREFRPDTFEKVYGQEHITEILKNQIKNQNIGHAYIFSGTRGTGKTSCAKILAKAVNCLEPVDGSPCNHCKNCKIIAKEESFDIVEMDAASNRRIDDIRELRDKVVYPPANLKYKVYIIDEAHMITKEGFNALLKIMEEPPIHLIFILATTEIEKIPDTILSRCQRYEFKRIGVGDIVSNLKRITDEIQMNIPEEGLKIIAEHADGAMRDALSILDQLYSYNESEMDVDEIRDILGLVSSVKIFKIVDAIIEKNPGNLLKIYRESLEEKSVDRFIDELIQHYRHLIYGKSGILKMIQTDQGAEKYEEQSTKISAEELSRGLQLLVETKDEIRRSDHPDILGELALIQLMEQESYRNMEQRIYRLEQIIKKMMIEGMANQKPNQRKTPETRRKEDIPSVSNNGRTKKPTTEDANTEVKGEDAEKTHEFIENHDIKNTEKWKNCINSLMPMTISTLQDAERVICNNNRIVVEFKEDNFILREKGRQKEVSDTVKKCYKDVRVEFIKISKRLDPVQYLKDLGLGPVLEIQKEKED